MSRKRGLIKRDTWRFLTLLNIKNYLSISNNNNQINTF